MDKPETNAWNPELGALPPVSALADLDLANFFVFSWNKYGRSNILNAQRYVNWALASYQKPSVCALGARSKGWNLS